MRIVIFITNNVAKIQKLKMGNVSIIIITEHFFFEHPSFYLLAQSCHYGKL